MSSVDGKKEYCEYNVIRNELCFWIIKPKNDQMGQR